MRKVRFAVLGMYYRFVGIWQAAIVLLDTAVLLAVVVTGCAPGIAPHWFTRASAATLPTALALGGLTVMAFWPHLWRLALSRNIAIGKEGLSLTELQGVSQQLSGTLRDNFIYLGNRLLYNRQYDLAYEHYASAHRMQKTLLSAYRAMQALVAHAKADNILQDPVASTLMSYFEDAVLLSSSPGENIQGRLQICHWVSLRRDCLFEGDEGVAKLRNALAQALKTDMQWNAL